MGVYRVYIPLPYPFTTHDKFNNTNLGKTKVCEFDVELLVEEDVLGLDVAVDNPLGVAVLHG